MRASCVPVRPSCRASGSSARCLWGLERAGNTQDRHAICPGRAQATQRCCPCWKAELRDPRQSRPVLSQSPSQKDEKGFLFLASENTARTSLREENRFVQFIWIKGGPGEPLPQRQALWSWPGLQAGRLICHRRSLGTGSRAPGIVITSFTQEALMEYSCKLAQIGLCSWLCF